jgi:hypothetical protein
VQKFKTLDHKFVLIDLVLDAAPAQKAHSVANNIATDPVGCNCGLPLLVLVADVHFQQHKHLANFESGTTSMVLSTVTTMAGEEDTNNLDRAIV